MHPVYIIDAVRTPIGKWGGALQSVRPDDLLAHVVQALLKRNPSVEEQAIEDVIAGAANQSGEDCRNVARMAALLAGLPVTVPGTTVNRLCASGLQAVVDASRAIACGDGSLYIAGGVESMTRAPWVMAKSSGAWSRQGELYDTTIGWRFTNKKLVEKYPPFNMGETAENVADQWKISREEQDQFAYNSQQKYFAALEAGRWQDETVPVPITSGGQNGWVTADEQPRKTHPEMLARLKPVFKEGGTVTAGNASGINDGAAALLLAGEEAIKQWGLQPMARIVSVATAGVDPAVMGIGPVPATRKALQRAGLPVPQLGLIELNEAFAATSIACIRELNTDPDCVNVNGGAIALGNPLGSSGARIAATLLHEMKRRRVQYGLATMCAGMGQGAAMIVEGMQ
ncbi:MAG: acetyl-CoA C-acyltransferase [Williamsia sp.]|nr:acetyl-CoA C-acyltransferase [Williamsia sp.]